MKMKRYYLSLLTLVLFGLSISQNWAQSEQPKLTIGCISDLHCEDGGAGSNITTTPVTLRTSTTTTLSSIGKNENIDLLLIGGDITSCGSRNASNISKENWNTARQELIEATGTAFKTSKTPMVLYTTGNHDFQAGFNSSTSSASYNSGDYFTTTMKDAGITFSPAAVPTATSGECLIEQLKINGSNQDHVAAYHYIYKGYDFVVLNTSTPQFSITTGNWYYTDAQVEWVAKKLEAIANGDNNKLIFFLLHIPFADNNNGDSGHGMPSSNSNTIKLKSTLAKYPNLIMFFGHDHSSSKAYISKNTSERVTHYDAKGDKLTMTSTSSHKGGSFSSVFMGSMNYRSYQNLYQALMVYVFDDRVELQMKDYSTSSSARPSGVSATLNPYTIYLSDGTEPEPQPASGGFFIKNNAKGTYLNASSDGLSLSSTKQGWDITSLGSSLFRVLTTSGNSSYNLCGMNGNNNIRVTSDHTTVNDEKYNCYFYEIADPTAETVTGTLTSEVKAGKYYFIYTKYTKNSTSYTSILGNTAVSNTGTDGNYLSGKSTTPKSNQISLSKSDATNYIYYIEAPVTYYGKATAIALTGGNVYAAATTSSAPQNKAYTGTFSATNSGVQGDVKLYLWANADDGYTFAGWSKNNDGSGELLIPESGKDYTQVSVNAESTEKDNPTEEKFYAVFKKDATSTSSYAILNYGNSQYLGINSEKLTFSTTAQDWSITYSSSTYTFKNSSYNLYYNSSTIRPNTSSSTGLYLFKIADINTTSSNWSATQVTTANIEPGYYFIARKSSSSNSYYPIGNTINTNGYISSISSTALASNYGNYTFKKSDNSKYVYYIGPTATLNIGATGYATYSNQDFDIAVPSDGTTTLYGAKFSIDDEMVSLIELPSGTKAIKKGTGLVVKGAPGTVTFLSATGGVGITGNELVASGVSGTYFDTEKEIYILSANGNSVVFKKNRYTSDDSRKNLLAPNKAYLPAPNPPKSKDILGIDEPTTTGIESVNVVNSKSSKAYNINGIQVNKNYMGIVIKDGKKFFVK